MLLVHRSRHLHPTTSASYPSSYRQLAASLRSGLKTRLNGLLALLMRTGGGGERRQLQYYQYHLRSNHYRYDRYQQQQQQPGEEEGTAV